MLHQLQRLAVSKAQDTLARRAFSSGKLRRGIYAGSFDPPTAGHLDIISRGTNLCDRLYVGIAVNSAKK